MHVGIVHIAISVSLLGTLIGDISDVRNQRLTALKKVELLKGSLDIELMKSLIETGTASTSLSL